MQRRLVIGLGMQCVHAELGNGKPEIRSLTQGAGSVSGLRTPAPGHRAQRPAHLAIPRGDHEGARPRMPRRGPAIRGRRPRNAMP